MKLIGIAVAFAAFSIALPAAALEGVPQCFLGPVNADVVQILRDKLSAPADIDTKSVPDTFYAELSCFFTDIGVEATDLGALSADEILTRAIDQQDLTRSRADALLAILKAMRQAREELAAPAPIK